MSAPHLIEAVPAFQDWRRHLDPALKVGFVPTMGALHAGHAALLKSARAECDLVVLSLFVNPTQFNNPDDLKAYPITLEQDLALADELGCHVVFKPDYHSLYPDDFAYRLAEDRVSRLMEGAHRPGHFDGVLSVVLKLLNLVKPHRAYFGLKDYQQYRLVHGMTEALFIDTEIVGIETVREADGLALSSRNIHLSADGRALAPIIHKTLIEAESPDIAVDQLRAAGFIVDYVEDFDGRRLAAVQTHLTQTGKAVRLIDNVAI